MTALLLGQFPDECAERFGGRLGVSFELLGI
jgi:hypothetical protein